MSVFSEVFLATSDDLKALSQEMNAFELPRCERAGIACVLFAAAAYMYGDGCERFCGASHLKISPAW